MKLQTILLVLASVVAVNSQAEDAQTLQRCQALLKKSAEGGESSPDEQDVKQKCMDCYGQAGCLLPEAVTEENASRCSGIECTTIIFDALDTATKRNSKKRIVW